MRSFELTWGGLFRVFEFANSNLKNGISDSFMNTLKYLYSQCTKEEREKLRTVLPLLIDEIEMSMRKSEFYLSTVINKKDE